MRDDFPAAVKAAVAARVGHVCSNPKCRQPTSGPSETDKAVTNVGVAGHITAASPDGPRFDRTLTAEERRGAGNALWLCQRCGKFVDDDAVIYTRETLREWKAQAEAAAREVIERGPKQAEPSHVNAAVHLGPNAVTVSGNQAVVLGPNAIQIHGPVVGAAPDPILSEGNQKAQAIRPWIGKAVTLSIMNTARAAHLLGPVRGHTQVTVQDCNEFFVTIQHGDTSRSISLRHVDVCFDNANRRLELQESH